MRRKPLSGLGLTVGALLGALSASAWAINAATGPNGSRIDIVQNPNTFNLQGNGVNVGQVEPGRPAAHMRRLEVLDREIQSRQCSSLDAGGRPFAVAPCGHASGEPAGDVAAGPGVGVCGDE